MRLEKERQHNMNMRKVMANKESDLLRNLDNIISKVCFENIISTDILLEIFLII